jgi:hypothetical protein
MAIQSHTNPNASPHILERSQEFLGAGGVPLDDAFALGGDRSELIFDDRRLLLTPNDTEYHEYARVMQEAGLPFVEGDPELSDSLVVVGEIPRDARTFPQFMFSRPSKQGATASDAFRLLGNSLGRILETGHTPALEDIALRSLLVVRSQWTILIPPMRFTATAPDSSAKLAQRMEHLLLPRYASYGGVALLHAFTEGLKVHGGA